MGRPARDRAPGNDCLANPYDAERHHGGDNHRFDKGSHAFPLHCLPLSIWEAEQGAIGRVKGRYIETRTLPAIALWLVAVNRCWLANGSTGSRSWSKTEIGKTTVVEEFAESGEAFPSDC